MTENSSIWHRCDFHIHTPASYYNNYKLTKKERKEGVEIWDKFVSELEKRNLGTKATRSSILETLYDRNYIKEKSIEATPLGMSLISTLEKHSPIIIDEKLTRSFEDQMQSITESKKDFLQKQNSVDFNLFLKELKISNDCCNSLDDNSSTILECFEEISLL